MIRRVVIAVLVVAIALLLAQGAQGASTEVHAPPSAPCKFENRMDLAINSEGIWFECVCEALQVGTVCDWYELGPAPDAAAARRSWRYVNRSTQRVLMVKHTWPRYLDPPRRTSKPKAVTVATPIAVTVASTAGKCADPFLADDAWSQAHGC